MSDADQHGSSPYAQRGRQGFLPGNPGRLPGSKNRISNAALSAVKSMSDDAIVVLRQKLAEGDWQAVLFVLDRVLPKGRSVELEGVSPSSIASQLVNGEITTSEAKDIAITLSKLAEVGEIAEIRTKIEALEKILSDARP